MRPDVLCLLAVSATSSAQPAPVCRDRATLLAPKAIAAGEVCDLPSEIIVVHATAGKPVVGKRASVAPLTGSVTVFARPGGAVRKGPIGPGSTDVDPCDGEGGGHAGCSMSGGQTITSPVLGKDSIVFGAAHLDHLVGAKGDQACRGAGTFPGDGGLFIDAVATCSTAKRFAIVTSACEGPSLVLFEAQESTHAGEVDRDAWTFHSPDGIALHVDPAGASAELVVGREREPCLTWSVAGR